MQDSLDFKIVVLLDKVVGFDFHQNVFDFRHAVSISSGRLGSVFGKSENN